MKKKAEEFNPYCEVCGGCGYIDCDGIIDFLYGHVKGKTNCKVEESYIREIIDFISPKEKEEVG